MRRRGSGSNSTAFITWTLTEMGSQRMLLGKQNSREHIALPEGQHPSLGSERHLRLGVRIVTD